MAAPLLLADGGGLSDDKRRAKGVLQRSHAHLRHSILQTLVAWLSKTLYLLVATYNLAANAMPAFHFYSYLGVSAVKCD